MFRVKRSQEAESGDETMADGQENQKLIVFGVYYIHEIQMTTNFPEKSLQYR